MSEAASLSEAVAEPPRRAVPGLDGLVLGAILALFGLLKLYSLNFVLGDEHLYNSMSLLIDRGKWPYRDFFFSHPPLETYLVAALFKLTGYTLAGSKLVPSLAALLTGVNVFLIGRRLYGRAEALLAAWLFLFSFDVLRGSSHLTGASLALMFLTAGVHQALARRPILGGALLALGTATGAYVAPMALMLIVLLALRARRESLRLAAAWLGGCALIAGIFLAVAGPAFWYQVVTFNRLKEPMAYSWFAKFRNVFYLNPAVMWGFVPAMAWAAATWARAGRAPGEAAEADRWRGGLGDLCRWLKPWNGDRIAATLLLSTFIFGYFLFYSQLPVYYSYYFTLVMPWMALLTASVVVDLARFALTALASGRAPSAPAEAEAVSRGERRRRAREQSRRTEVGVAASSGRFWPALATVGAGLVVLVFRLGVEADRTDEMGDEPQRYTWRDSRYLGGGLNGLIRGLFWSDVREARGFSWSFARYLQHESVHAASIDSFVAGVRKECGPDERIFGEYSLAPFAASVSDCVLAADLADTNTHRIKAGESSMEDWIAAVEGDGLAIAVVRQGSFMLKDPAMRSYLLGTFPSVVFTWTDPAVGRVELRRRAPP